MIISHTHKYLFVEVPHTGSTAISKELCESYDGKPILKKHSFYSDFLKTASPEEKKYFVFSGIRNPLDEAVSKYYKLKTDHKQVYTDPDKIKKHTRIAHRRAREMFKTIQNNNLDFETYFRKSYVLPYNNWAILTHGHYKYLIRFENLQEDFFQALRLIQIEPKRPLPNRNTTAGRKRDFISYYSPALIPRAKRVFGPFMKQWGYEFPPEWGANDVPRWNQFEFEFINLLRIFYWQYLRI